MLGARKQKTTAKIWVLIVTGEKVGCFSMSKHTSGKPSLLLEAVIDGPLSAPDAVTQLSKLVPSGAKLLIGLPAKNVVLQSFVLDRLFSKKEAKTYILAQLSKLMKLGIDDISYSCEQVSVSDNGRCDQLITAANKANLREYKKFLFEHNWQCIRLESSQAIIAWLAYEQIKQSEMRYWGTLELIFDTLNLLFLDRQQVLCQKSFFISNDNVEINIVMALGKVKQVISLLQIQGELNVFCNPSLYVLLVDRLPGAQCVFHSLSILDHTLPANYDYNETQLHYMACALVVKSAKLD